MLLLLSSGLWGVELVERFVGLLFEFGIAAGANLESA